MRYPTIDRTVCADLVDQLARGEQPSTEAVATWTGSGDDIDLKPLDAALAPLREDLEAIVAGERVEDREVFEGRVAAATHAALAPLDPFVLDDRGFWRYLGLTRFWWYTSWREAKPIAAGNARTYTDATQAVMAIPTRLFLRGQAVHDGCDYAPASALPRSADFWRSHVLRVRVGTSPALTRAFVRLQQDKQMKTDPQLRPYARQLNRTWTNVVLHLYDEDEALDLLEEMYESMEFTVPNEEEVSG